MGGRGARAWLGVPDQLNPVAEIRDTAAPFGVLDGADETSRFVYGSRANVPDYMVRGGTTYRILSDHLGSPRVVVETSTGSAAQRIDYDEFGRATVVAGNADFQPFGFAGGLWDPDTNLTRFGARDYDATAGRWTSRDPIGFRGSPRNLHNYIAADPINLIDPSGLLNVTKALVGAGQSGCR